jgi:transposase-like protein
MLVIMSLSGHNRVMKPGFNTVLNSARKRGKKPMPWKKKLAIARAHKNQKLTVDEVCRIHGISLRTLYRVLKDVRKKKEKPQGADTLSGVSNQPEGDSVGTKTNLSISQPSPTNTSRRHTS